jgi:hypothetical protein
LKTRLLLNRKTHSSKSFLWNYILHFGCLKMRLFRFLKLNFQGDLATYECIPYMLRTWKIAFCYSWNPKIKTN